VRISPFLRTLLIGGAAIILASLWAGGLLDHLAFGDATGGTQVAHMKDALGFDYIPVGSVVQPIENPGMNEEKR
jgi:hypothetical protein